MQADWSNYQDVSKVELVDNFLPYMFSRNEARKHNKLVDNVEVPGIDSTIKWSVAYSQAETIAHVNIGFDYSYTRDGKFYLCGNLLIWH